MGNCLSNSQKQNIVVSPPPEDDEEAAVVVKEVLSENPNEFPAGETPVITDYSSKGEEILSGKDEDHKERRLSDATTAKKPQRKRTVSGEFQLRRDVKKAESGRGLGRSYSGGLSQAPTARSSGMCRTSSFKGGTPAEAPDYLDGGGAWTGHMENGEATRGKESMENPLVSLECFIFL